MPLQRRPHTGFSPLRSIRIALLAAAIGLVGCAATIEPPADPTAPVWVYDADYGYHTGLILPAPGEGRVPYARGERGWFADTGETSGPARDALLGPTPGPLGRRRIARPQDAAALRRALDAQRLLALPVSAAAATRRRQALDDRFERAEATARYNPVVKLTFVDDWQEYSLAESCNRIRRLSR